MSKRRVQQPDLNGFRWIECYVDAAVNPRTKRQVTFTSPVRIGCSEDFVRFNDQWEEFCKLLSGDPDEVYFTLE